MESYWIKKSYLLHLNFEQQTKKEKEKDYQCSSMILFDS